MLDIDRSTLRIRAPVLSVAADAVRELQGSDALYGLWTLFTKCKESLQDGRRLENLSWRLWYRSMNPRDNPGPRKVGKLILDILPSNPLPFNPNPSYTIPATTISLPTPNPRLVLTNPTPGPSPHPTPPTTPILQPLGAHRNTNDTRRNHPIPLSLAPPTPSSGSSGSSSARTAFSSGVSSPVNVASTAGPGAVEQPALVITDTETETRAVAMFSASPDSTICHSTTTKTTSTAVAVAPRPGHVRRTSSTGSGRKPSRSKSRETGPPLAMTTTAAPTAKRGGKPRAQLGPVRRTTSGRGGAVPVAMRRAMSSNTTHTHGKHKPRFDIGSHSDEGSAAASKSTGSRSPVSRLLPTHPEHATDAKPAKARSPPTLLPPLSTRLPHPEAVIPQPQHRRTTIVLATSESEYETETESESGEGEGAVGKDDGDGDWSSDDAVQAVNSAGRASRAAPVARPQLPLQHAPPQNVPAPAPAPAPHPAAHHAHPTNHPPKPAPARARTAHPTHHPLQIEAALLEAQRLRDMFAKKHVPGADAPAAAKRTRSVGLLSQLMNPDPRVFPVGHPCRRGFSSGELAAPAGWREQASAHAHAQGKEQANGHVKERLPPGPPPQVGLGLRTRKGAAALPVASQVLVGSVAVEPLPHATTATALPHPPGRPNGPSTNGVGSGGYRPKGRPAGQEMEDSSESDDDAGGGDARAGQNGVLLLSRSVAQEKLKALAMRRGIVQRERERARERSVAEEGEGEGEVPRWAKEGHTHGASGSAHPAPIPVGHPYNLPPPTAPSTPRTTRRLMLQTEMSESLRRNLLWERQVSKVSLVGFRRTASGGAGAGAAGNVLGGVRPLATRTTSVVQLTAKKAGAAQGEVLDGPRADGAGGGPPRGGVVRNRSWAADDYHTSGW